MSVRSASSVFFFKQKTAYEMRISDWSPDVCSSDLFARSGRNRVPAIFGMIADGIFAGAGGYRQDTLGHRIAGGRRGAGRPDDIGKPEAFNDIAGPEIGSASCRERVCQ